MTISPCTRLLIIAIVAVAAVALKPPSSLAQSIPAEIDVSTLQIPPGAVIDAAPLAGDVEVWVTLADAPVGAMSGRNAKRGNGLLSRTQQREYSRRLAGKHDDLVGQIQALGGREMARVRKAHNAVAIRINAARLAEVAALPGVRAVRPVRSYHTDLSTTVPYIGAAAVAANGVDGSGTTVAVLDSGIDYTHRNLGGSGIVDDYLAAYGSSASDPRNTSRDGLFPTTKVVHGYDFVGEAWPNGPLAPDDDPIDVEGHGTHVADIIAGGSVDNLHRGVAPGSHLFAVKVCSSVSTACSGVALLQGLDFAIDPNGDDDLSDAVDVINMSLGSDYGQEEDDLTEASATAVEFGVVVVAAAGNAGNRPYIVSSPSIGAGVISVAQTSVPDATAIPLMINAPASIAGADPNTATLDFAPVTTATTGDVVYLGRGCPAAGTTPPDPYVTDPTGKIALIDRGVCATSLKVDRAAAAGAIGVLIALIADGDPASFSYGGGTQFVPSLVITQSAANLIKANVEAPVNVTMTPEFGISLTTSVVGSSARGPSYNSSRIKPDLGAPGASVSAIAGTGTREEAFSGTSGATPMVAGAAALLLQARPHLEPIEVRALLMNTAETSVYANPATSPGVLAPITRIGAGELRVDRAVGSETAAWDEETGDGSVSFGYGAVSAGTERRRRISIRNYSNKAKTYSVEATFRYDDDAASRAVNLAVPSSVRVAAGGTKSFVVTLTVDPARLPDWNLNGGNKGGNGALLEAVEFDGYIAIADGTDSVHLPWHVLPHKAAAVIPTADVLTLRNGAARLPLVNAGAVAGRVDIFSLTGTSPKIPKSQLPQPGDNQAIIDLKAVGVRLVNAGELGIQFGIATNHPRSHPNYPAEFDVLIDTDRDGTIDFVVFNRENGDFATTGQNVVAVENRATGTTVVRFFADADLDSGNFIATVLLSDLGMTATSTFDFTVVAFDNYFTGTATDAIERMTYTPAAPRFVAAGLPAGGVPERGASALTVEEVPGADLASPSQTGLLLLYRDAAPSHEASVIEIR